MSKLRVSSPLLWFLAFISLESCEGRPEMVPDIWGDVKNSVIHSTDIYWAPYVPDACPGSGNTAPHKEARAPAPPEGGQKRNEEKYNTSGESSVMGALTEHDKGHNRR